MQPKDLTPDLEPVTAFHESDELEMQLKSMTQDVFRQFYRASERDLNTYGSPHLGSFDRIERWIKADGLAMVRGDSENSMRYLFKAWRGQNPRRGLHFLRTYLQLLWPNGWSVDQLWQKKSAAYPTALYTLEELTRNGVADPRRDYFLTSRVNVDVSTQEESGAGVAQVSRSLRSACGAKFLVRLRTLRRGSLGLSMASIGTPSQFLSSSGNLLPLEGSGASSSVTASIGTPSQFLSTGGIAGFI